MFTGKKFPSIKVPATNTYGDQLEINVLKKAIEEKKKVLLF